VVAGMKVKIIGTQSTYAVEPLYEFQYEGRKHVIHYGHNSLINSVVISDYLTGVPRKVYTLAPDEEVVYSELVEGFVNGIKMAIPKQAKVINRD